MGLMNDQLLCNALEEQQFLNRSHRGCLWGTCSGFCWGALCAIKCTLKWPGLVPPEGSVQLHNQHTKKNPKQPLTRVGPTSGSSVRRSTSTELGTFGIFNFFNNRKWFFGIFYKVNNLFLHQSYLKSTLPVKLTRPLGMPQTGHDLMWQQMLSDSHLFQQPHLCKDAMHWWCGPPLNVCCLLSHTSVLAQPHEHVILPSLKLHRRGRSTLFLLHPWAAAIYGQVQ